MEKEKKGSWLKIAIVVGVLVVLAVVAYSLGLVDFLTDVNALQAWFRELGFWAYLVYILIYILVAVFMLPASAFTIAAGITFGSVAGGLISLVGATIGATVAFIIAKYLCRDLILRKFENYAVFKKIEEGVKENGTSFLILTRLVPIFPYNVQNYAYGVTPMNVFTFAIVSLITMAPGSFIYAFLAGEIVTNGISLTLLLQFAAAGVILFLVSLVPKYIAKKKGIKIK